ncbi:hypothetical protein RclHR1_11680001 [Rhizophagus clarus]|uniref:Uncharacterized protein n=1 Tax=Rhizophagus clarus TaxID=94130 RepID=A0A2Z6QXV0_9GLOM|nr:hypothetical protein RclHR1_11680001 [Rhizophagus clarus]GES73924.1 hypothetical protein GLOIN_2v1473489 [Rhizophagus clarus]
MIQVLQMNECIRFFHYTPDDNNFYHITCHIISRDSAFSDDHDDDHGFFYNDSEINYYIKCKLFSRPLIITILNREIYGIDNEVNNLEGKNSLSLNQKLSLEQDLKQILPLYFMKNYILKREIRSNFNKNMNPFHEHYKEQMVLMTDIHNNFGNRNEFYHNGDVKYDNYDVTHQHQQQHFGFNNNMTAKRETDSFHGNIENNLMVSPHATLMPDNNQNNNINEGYIRNVIPQHQINFNMSFAEREMRPDYKSSTNISHGDNTMTTQMNDIQSNYLPHQNRAEDTRQVDFNKFPQHRVPESEMRSDYDINTYSSHDSVTTYAVSTTDINLEHHFDYTRNAYSHQQIDLNCLPVTTQGNATAEINRSYNENSMSYNNNQVVNIAETN